MKDTNNLLTYNQWSGTDYLENNTGFAVYNSNDVSRSSSNNWSSNGEHSLKVNKLSDSNFWVRAYYQDSILSKTITGKLTIKTNNSRVKVYLIELNGSTSVQTTSITVPANTVSSVNLSLTSGDTNTRFALHTVSLDDVEDHIYYIDNLQLYASQ